MTTHRFTEPYPIIKGPDGPVEITDVDSESGECSTRRVQIDPEEGQGFYAIGTITVDRAIIDRWLMGFQIQQTPEEIDPLVPIGGDVEMKRELLRVGNKHMKKLAKAKK